MRDSRRSTKYQRSESLAGLYHSERFSILLSPEDSAFVDGKPPKLVKSSTGPFSTLTHEYWHFLSNLSFVSRFRELRLSQEELALFSHTISRNGTSRHSNGRGSLSEEQRERLNVLASMRCAYQGDETPAGLTEQPEDFKIISFEPSVEVFNLDPGGVPVKIDIMTLSMVARHDSGSSLCEFRLGTHAIEESLAYEIDRIVDTDHPSDDGDKFPYFVGRKFIEHLLEHSPSRYEVCALLTMALNTSESTVALVNFAGHYKSLIACGYERDAAFAKVWDGVRNDYLSSWFPAIVQDLNGIVEMQLRGGEVHTGFRAPERSHFGTHRGTVFRPSDRSDSVCWQ